MDFVVTPDLDMPPDCPITLHTDRQEIAHPSGRPLVRGRWEEHEVLTVSTGNRRVVLLGSFDADEATLARHCARVRRGGDLATLAAAIPGAYHLIASIDGVVHARGTLSSRCQVFYRAWDGVTVAADRPDALTPARTLGEVRVERLAPLLLAPVPPWPFHEDPVWEGVDAVPAGHHLELDRDGRARTTLQWTSPAPEVPMAEAAPRIREALRGAVRARLRGHPSLSADLSGGLDSTSLCFLVADVEPGRLAGAGAGGAERGLTTFRREVMDRNNDDRGWAEFAAGRLPGVRHIVDDRENTPRWFGGLTEPPDDLEGPPSWIRTLAEEPRRDALLAASGSTAHLIGDGGDELFFATPAHLHALARRDPLLALSHARHHRTLRKWRRGATLAALLRSRSFAQEMEEMADGLTAPPPTATGRPDISWGVQPRSPGWATEDMRETVRAVIQTRVAGRIAPLAPLAAQHMMLANARMSGQMARQRTRLSERAGVSLHAPYLDDHVIEATLSLALADTVPASRYKPGLTEAMHGVVPAPLLERRTKHEFSADAYAGLRHNRDALWELSADMRLEKLGLVDAAAFRAALTGSHVNSLTIVPLIPTLACEVWLRSLPDGG